MWLGVFESTQFLRSPIRRCRNAAYNGRSAVVEWLVVEVGASADAVEPREATSAVYVGTRPAPHHSLYTHL